MAAPVPTEGDARWASHCLIEYVARVPPGDSLRERGPPKLACVREAPVLSALLSEEGNTPPMGLPGRDDSQ